MHNAYELAACGDTCHVAVCHKRHNATLPQESHWRCIDSCACAAHRYLDLDLELDFTWAFATRKCLEATWEINKRAHATNCGNFSSVGCCRFFVSISIRNDFTTRHLMRCKERRDSRLLLAAQMSAALLTTFCTYMHLLHPSPIFPIPLFRFLGGTRRRLGEWAENSLLQSTVYSLQSTVCRLSTR